MTGERQARLTEDEREALYSPIGNDEAYPELPGVVAELIDARLRGQGFRVEVACMGYEALVEDDVPAEWDDDQVDAYRAGAAAAARAIRAELNHPADPYCPEHGTEPTTYDRCTCRDVAKRPGERA